jgi:2,3,4,5-tetrahydropyridine-2-carboxylate N-succinyltransferase
MNPLQTIIEQAWENRALLQETTTTDAIREVIELLDTGNYVLRSQLAKDGK